MRTFQISEIERDAIVGHLRVAADAYVTEAIKTQHDGPESIAKYRDAAMHARNLASQLETLPGDAGMPVDKPATTFPESHKPAPHGDPLRSAIGNMTL